MAEAPIPVVVPQSELGDTVQARANLGATEIQCTKNADGTWTVVSN